MEPIEPGDSKPEIETEVYQAIEEAEKYASHRIYRSLERRLPELLKIARRLSEQAGAILLSLDRIPAFIVPNEPTILLNRLVAAFHEYFMVSGRRNLLTELARQAYLTAYHADYENHWHDSVCQAGVMVRLAYERLSVTDLFDQYSSELPAPKELLAAYSTWENTKSEILKEMYFWFNRVIKISQESRAVSKSELWTLEALLASGENNWIKARQLFSKSLKTYEADADVAGQIRTLIELAHVEEQDGKAKKAEAYYKLALAKAEQDAYDYYLAECCYKLGSIALADKDYFLAQARFERALRLGQHFRLRYLQAATLRELARTCKEQARGLKDLEHRSEALEVCNRALNYASQALEIEKALKTWRKAATENLITMIEAQKAELQV